MKNIGTFALPYPIHSLSLPAIVAAHEYVVALFSRSEIIRAYQRNGIHHAYGKKETRAVPFRSTLTTRR